VPDELSVSIYLVDPVEWDGYRLTGRIVQDQRKMIIRLKPYSPQRDHNDPLLAAVEVADGEISPAIVLVPADTVEQFANGNHSPSLLDV
jgi:hypothetical protein